MKRFFLLALTAGLLPSCSSNTISKKDIKYPSYFQAYSACINDTKKEYKLRSRGDLNGLFSDSEFRRYSFRGISCFPVGTNNKDIHSMRGYVDYTTTKLDLLTKEQNYSVDERVILSHSDKYYFPSNRMPGGMFVYP